MVAIINRGDWIQTFRGGRFYPSDPKPSEIFIEDIAHALSMNCRYTGHCKYFYSVAEHSANCALMAPEKFKLEALLHDSSEAYLADIARPVKRMLPDYQAIEKKVEMACAEKFNLPWPMSETVKLIDNRMLVTEAAHLMPKGAEKWWEDSHWPPKFENFLFVPQNHSENHEYQEYAFLENYYGYGGL